MQCTPFSLFHLVRCLKVSLVLVVSVENIFVAEIFDEDVSLGFPVGKLKDFKTFMEIQFVDENFDPLFG